MTSTRTMVDGVLARTRGLWIFMIRFFVPADATHRYEITEFLQYELDPENREGNFIPEGGGFLFYPGTKVEIEVMEKRETKKPDRGIVTYRHRTLNQKDVVVLEYRIDRMIRRKTGEV